VPPGTEISGARRRTAGIRNDWTKRKTTSLKLNRPATKVSMIPTGTPIETMVHGVQVGRARVDPALSLR
jgi:hypothetical protein